MAENLAEVINRSMPYKPTTIKRLLIDAARDFPDRTAVVSLHQPGDLYPVVNSGAGAGSYLRWTYGELLYGARRLATSLRSHGIRRGDAIASMQLNGADWALCFWTAALLECPWVAIQPRTATNVEEINHILDVSSPRVLLASNDEQVGQLRQSVLADTLDGLVKICSVPVESEAREWATVSSLLETPSSDVQRYYDHEAPLDQAEGLALVLFTSGTTGQPKGCMHTQRSVTSMFRNHACSLDLDGTSSSVSHLTLSHCFGMLYSGSFWSRGAKVVYPSPNFDVKASLKAMEMEGSTHMPAVPSLLHSLIECPGLSKLSLRHIEFSGAMVTAETVKQARQQLGAQVVSSHFGMSESGPAALWSYHEIPDVDTTGDFASPGLPVPGGKLRICAPGTRTPLQRGEAGEIHQSSPHVIKGYLGGVSSDSFYEDDSGVWLITGDQGTMLDNGEIRVGGRYKDIIIRGGENIAPAQMEAVLNTREHLKVCRTLMYAVLLTHVDAGPDRRRTRRYARRGACRSVSRRTVR